MHYTQMFCDVRVCLPCIVPVLCADPLCDKRVWLACRIELLPRLYSATHNRSFWPFLDDLTTFHVGGSVLLSLQPAYYVNYCWCHHGSAYALTIGSPCAAKLQTVYENSETLKNERARVRKRGWEEGTERQ